MKKSKTLPEKSNGVHYTEGYLLNPTHQITVALIGAGGTGSQVLTCLARMNVTLQALGHPGLFVTLIDDDVVSEANLGRQLFSKADIDRNKADVLIERVNRFFNTNWVAHCKHITLTDRLKFNIIISCTDNNRSRLSIRKLFYQKSHGQHRDYMGKYYWLDFGNGNTYGQIVLSDRKKTLKDVFTLFPKAQFDKSNDTPSCSIAEAIKKQDLFVNSTLAQLGCNFLWKLFREGKTEYQGIFMNLEKLTTKPIKINKNG